MTLTHCHPELALASHEIAGQACNDRATVAEHSRSHVIILNLLQYLASVTPFNKLMMNSATEAIWGKF